MKFLVTYKICGPTLKKARVTAESREDAVSKVRQSLKIIKCEEEENETLRQIKEIFKGFK